MNLIKHHGLVAVERPSAEPLPLTHIIGIGRNYADHASEMGGVVPERPMYFTKNPASACLHNDPILIPPICRDPETGGPDQVDFEAELAVVIGTAARDVSEANAYDHVLGLCCANDVSARWWQKQGSGGQFNRGKSFDTFCPLGPRLVPIDEVGDPQKLDIKCRVSGEEMQSSSTSLMIYTVAYLIAELSKSTTLLPGTVILTGTPSGVGFGRDPKRFLKPGDTVEVEISGLGVLSNPVVDGY
ncbi:MAG: fumarylacetoacetate hydrolase family protein [Phycisphaerales bacterium]|nr:fumarylacetoacetate hydrolase family protein [Phycisphaerales bacterium]MCB9836771.1 fumarylacetoacetate hydrolase family protein [Phycisphaera sp.]